MDVKRVVVDRFDERSSEGCRRDMEHHHGISFLIQEGDPHDAIQTIAEVAGGAVVDRNCVYVTVHEGSLPEFRDDLPECAVLALASAA